MIDSLSYENKIHNLEKYSIQKHTDIIDTK